MTIKRWEPDKVKAKLIAKVERNMAQAALYAKGEVQRSINRGNADGTNPSLPGEPPKKVSARLFQSITTRVRKTAREVIGSYGTNVEYARRLEFGFHGTDSRGRNINQEPRPFLRPILKTKRREILAILSRE